MVSKEEGVRKCSEPGGRAASCREDQKQNQGLPHRKGGYVGLYLSVGLWLLEGSN